ncbi:MAG: hypothetical protein FLDDKLPJ_03664 [Phycisphaerae bacterium]|nr:hypothetical protein [Phycisphaerae bacterium]
MRCESNHVGRMAAMEREQIQRDRQREGQEKTHEQPKDLSGEQRTFVASNIERCESRARQREGPSAPPAGSPPGDKPKDLDERFEKDFQAVREIKGLNPEVWSKASERERMETLREVEKTLAQSQERKDHRLYAVPELAEKEEFNGRMLVQPNDTWKHGRLHDSEHWTATDRTHVRDLTRNSIVIDEGRVQENDPRRAFLTLAEECRHAYQSAVLNPVNKNKYSEVDAETREKWQYGKDVYVEHFSNPELHKKNPLEKDATAYAEQMTQRMYGKDRSAS